MEILVGKNRRSVVTLSEEITEFIKNKPNNLKLLRLLDKVKLAEESGNVDALLMYRRQFEKFSFKEKMLKVALSTLQGLGVSKVTIEENKFTVTFNDGSTAQMTPSSS